MNIQKKVITEVNSLHYEIESALKDSLGKALKIGGHLDRVKSELPHGHFTTWASENLAFNIRTAQRYMKLYQNRDRITGAESIQNAYKLLKPKNDTVSYLPIIGTGALPGLCNWYDIFSGYVLLLDTIEWSVDEIANETQQPAGDVLKVLNPTANAFNGSPSGWNRAVQREISFQLSEAYRKAAHFADIEGYPEAKQTLETLSKYHAKTRDRLSNFITPDNINGKYDQAADVLLTHTMRDALGIENKSLGACWHIALVETASNIETISKPG